jgi:hypothetical protein
MAVIKDPDSKRGIEEALLHVSRGWFPVNSAVVGMVRDRMRDGSYRNRYDLLLSDLKKDLGLFTFCLRQVGSVIDGPVHHRSPAEILSSLELEKFENLLARTQSVVGVHAVDPTQRAQLMRLRHSIISASTAETLAGKSKLDPQQAFLVATVRQLGLNLVAWNYPRIYAKALHSAGKGEGDLEELLLRTLGYSPLELGARSALDWCEHPDTQAVISNDSSALSVGVSKHAQKMKHLCEVGEVLAQIHDPEYFPKAVAHWQATSTELEQQLGSEGLALIKGKVDGYTSGYAALIPSGFKCEINPHKALQDAVGLISDRLFEDNQFAHRCPPGIVEMFRQLYRSILPGRPSPNAIKELVERIIPALGFERGCVYLVDQKKLQAVPMLRIGDVAIDRFRPLNCSDTGSSIHPVVEALSYQAPIIQENAFINGDQVAHVTGVFGTKEKVGVLYLEMSPELRDGDRAHILHFFKAVREALNDSLNMRPGNTAP